MVALWAWPDGEGSIPSCSHTYNTLILTKKGGNHEMRTVILSGVSQRGKQKIHLHGTRWEILKEEQGRFLLKSSGATFHMGDGVMEHDWRFVQIHFDKDFKIEFGKGQSTPPKFSNPTPDTIVSLQESLRNDQMALNLELQSLKGNRK